MKEDYEALIIEVIIFDTEIGTDAVIVSIG